MALAIAAPTMPSTIFMISPMLLFMNCSASQPAIPPIMIAAIQPTPASPIAHLLEKAHVAPEHGASDRRLPVDLYQRADRRQALKGFSRREGGQHVMGLAGPGCVDIPGARVRRGNDSERE